MLYGGRYLICEAFLFPDFMEETGFGRSFDAANAIALLDDDDDTDEEIQAAIEEQASLQLTPELVAIPPNQTVRQVADFAVQRDGRFVDPFAGPIAVVIYPPNGSPIWVDLGGAQLIDIIDDEPCALDEHVFMVDRDGIAPVRPEPVEEEAPTE